MSTHEKVSPRQSELQDPVAVPPAKLAHVVFRTGQLAVLRDWYEQVLGARAVFDNGYLAFMTYDEEHHRLALVADSTVVSGPPNDQRLEHVAFTYASLGNLLATYTRLKALGITPYSCINHGPTTSVYYRDPDGNQIELQADNFATLDALVEWFRTSTEFRQNPVGVVFDPDRLVERYGAGDPIEELVRQGAA